MEILQYIQYNYVGQCGQFMNYYTTIVAHCLVVVQPFIWNLYRYRKNSENKDVFLIFMHLGIIWSIGYTLRLFIRGSLNLREMNVGNEICVYDGIKHLYWTLPYNDYAGAEPNFFLYLLIWFYPSVYEKHNGIVKLSFWITNLTVAYNLSGTLHEVSSTWCLFSIPMCILMSFIK